MTINDDTSQRSSPASDATPGGAGARRAGPDSLSRPGARRAAGASANGGDAEVRTHRGGSRRKGPPPKLYRIGEVVDYAAVSRQTIHNYTVMGLIRESGWTRGGHRLYGEAVFERLDRIAELRAENRSLREIGQELAEMDR
jgi:hypothetical protein